ncbi:MAG: hypothetical protein WDO17_07500 [Alphaproteobacteria bacterium]
MAHEYRYMAKTRLAKATKLLATNDEDDLVYACLELRKCIEAISYETFTAYLTEVPLKAFEAWQPDKVMKELLRIDPEADHTSHLRFKTEGRNGEPDGEWQDMGEDRRMKLKWATKAYHSLGSFLHVPTIKQEREGLSFDAIVARERADKIGAELAHILDSTIWNANFSVFVTVACTECEAPIKRRSSVLEKGEPVECGNCGQQFKYELQPADSYFFMPVAISWKCEACDEPRTIMQSKMKNGEDASCPKCGDRAKIAVQTSWVLEREAPANAPAEATAAS